MSSKYYVYVIKPYKKVSNLKKFRSRNPLYLKSSGWDNPSELLVWDLSNIKRDTNQVAMLGDTV